MCLRYCTVHMCRSFFKSSLKKGIEALFETAEILQFEFLVVTVKCAVFQYNQGQYGKPERFDLNIMPVWKRNITGRGIVVSIIDDGESLLLL